MKNQNRNRKIAVSCIATLLAGLASGCARGFESAATSLASEAAQENPPQSAQPEAPDFNLGICSRLDFSEIVWPEKLLVTDRRAMALALNVTGSYEGGSGWSNLANNFDGQGISLGLNQQNFGQNTLQPLMIGFLEKNSGLATKIFSSANLRSLTLMLEKWKGSKLEVKAIEAREFDLFPDQAALSKLDEGFEESLHILDAKSAASVAWAKATLFQSNGTSFKTDWRQSLVSLALTAPYRSAQLEEALSLFSKAKNYFQSLRFTELRSLLVMYDFVVQNGGFNSTHLAQFRQFDVQKPKATETERLLKLLEIRLVSVRDQYKNDVKARKSTIINGTGKVHGANRNLETEYCVKLREPVAGTPIPAPR